MSENHIHRQILTSKDLRDNNKIIKYGGNESFDVEATKKRLSLINKELEEYYNDLYASQLSVVLYIIFRLQLLLL